MAPTPNRRWSILWCATALALPLIVASDAVFTGAEWFPFAVLLYLNAERRPGLIAVPSLMLMLAAMDVARLTGWWPCDIACQGGAHYQRIAGVSVIVPALIAHLGLAALALRDLRRGGSCPWSIRAGWFLLGVSLFFVVIAYALDLHCPYCRAVHWGTIAAVVCLAPLPAGMRWWQPVAWCLAGALTTNAVFHHRPVADVADPTRTPATTVEVDAAVAANAGRTYGDPSATRTLEVFIDLTCLHCAKQYRPLMVALQPAIAAKRVRVIVRHVVRPSQSASKPAAELALATALMGDHAAGLDVLLGSNPDSGQAGLQARLAEIIDPTKLDAVLARDIRTIRRVIADDQSRLMILGIGTRTPSAVLLEDGKVTRRWVGDLPHASIVAALDDAH